MSVYIGFYYGGTSNINHTLNSLNQKILHVGALLMRIAFGGMLHYTGMITSLERNPAQEKPIENFTPPALSLYGLLRPGFMLATRGRKVQAEIKTRMV